MESKFYARALVISVLSFASCISAQEVGPQDILWSPFAETHRSPLDQTCIPIDRAGYVIEKPGRYCVTKDLHTRFDFADHSAERALIEIDSSDVELDLQGHRLGRGWLFTQPGGNGIIIGTRLYREGDRTLEDLRMDITIQNGRITDMNSGIYFYRDHRRVITPVLPRTLLEVGPGIYKYDTTNIVIKDITFERCKNNFSFRDWASSREMYMREKDASPRTFNSR